ncbi:MAG: hypothetical protein EU552_00065 [Promethearchaeota archaeon]|nr:MAG: hypothetical protein EU552_00065 [Candidatus Lokiarchaeota archaeon]
MESIFDLYERDFISDILALTNIGKRISGNKDLMINFIGNIPSVYTDCRFIYLPDKFKKDLRSAQGLVAHESGHIGYGSFELCFIRLVDSLAKKYKVPLLFAKSLINVVEDVRINGINKIKFPGFYRNLRSLTKRLIPEIRSRLNSIEGILSYINLYMEDFEDFQKRPKFKLITLSKKDWKGISKVKSFLYKSLSPSSSIISCDILCKILKKYLPEPPTNPPSNGRSPQNQHRNTLTQMELNSRNKKCDEKTQLDKTSEELIEKLEDQDLDPDDLDDLMNKENGRKSNKEEERDNEKKEKSKNQEEQQDKLEDNQKEKQENIDAVRNRDQKTGQFSYEIEGFKENLIKGAISEEKDKNKGRKEEFIREIRKLIERADDAMQERLLTLERQEYRPTPRSSKEKRHVDEVKIESQAMAPVSITYAQIKAKYSNIIKRLKIIFADLKNTSANDTFQKNGRLNSKFIKAVTSDYQFKRCFTRKIINKELRLIIIVDISGSMRGVKVKAAKIAMVMLYEALEDIADIRIILFTGAFHALNILVKDFNERIDPKKFDKFGCHSRFGQNVDGVSIKHEANKLKKNDIIIVISDGQPAADGGYSLYDAIPDIHEVRKIFRVFAFSIDSQGDYLNKLYGKDWILTSSRNELELGQKMVRFSQILVKEFYR